MDITITIPDDKKDAVIDAFAIQYKYQDKITDKDDKEIDNPISKGDFVLGIIESFIKDVYVANKVKEFEKQRNTVVTYAKDDVKEINVVEQNI